MLQVAKLCSPCGSVGQHDNRTGTGSAADDMLARVDGECGVDAAGKCLEFPGANTQPVKAAFLAGKLVNELVERFHLGPGINNPRSEAE